MKHKQIKKYILFDNHLVLQEMLIYNLQKVSFTFLHIPTTNFYSVYWDFM